MGYVFSIAHRKQTDTHTEEHTHTCLFMCMCSCARIQRKNPTYILIHIQFRDRTSILHPSGHKKLRSAWGWESREIHPAPAAEINAGTGMPRRDSPSPTEVNPSAAAPAAWAGSEPPQSSPGPDPRVPARRLLPYPRGWGAAQGRKKPPRF